MRFNFSAPAIVAGKKTGDAALKTIPQFPTRTNKVYKGV
jgi:hypothetical protein